LYVPASLVDGQLVNDVSASWMRRATVQREAKHLDIRVATPTALAFTAGSQASSAATSRFSSASVFTMKSPVDRNPAHRGRQCSP
jgi:hypothetical protein